MREIETRQASLDTLAVTIQALHVSGKQMTLAVFRQLPVTSAYQEDGSLSRLEHWGLVRYSIKDEGDLWLVASFDGRLYRCAVGETWMATNDARHAQADAKSAEDELRRYREWEAGTPIFEAALIEYRKAEAAREERCPLDREDWTGRHQWKQQHPLKMPYPSGPVPERGWKAGQEEEFEELADTANERAQSSQRKVVSQAYLLLLTQLFIAV